MDAQTWQLISIVGYTLAGLLFIIAIIMFIKMNIWSVIGDLTGRTAAKQIQEIRKQNAKTGSKSYRPSAFNLDRGRLTEPVYSRSLGRKGKTGATNKGPWNRMGRGQTSETVRPGITNYLPTGALPKQENPLPVHLQNTGRVTEDTTVLVDDRVSVGAETTVIGNEVASSVEATNVIETNATTVLNDRFVEDTTILDNGTEVLIDGTEVLSDWADEFDRGTEVLTEDEGTTVLNPTEDLSNEEYVHQAVDFKMVKDIKIIHTDKVI